MNQQRAKLIDDLWNRGYIKSSNIKKAMLRVPREEFMPSESRPFAYADRPLPIGKGQTISAPHMVAILAEKLDLHRGMKVLEIGTGYGYNAAVIAEIIGPEGKVISVERIESLATKAQKNLRKTGYGDMVEVINGDGTLGYPQEAPFDRIYATASAPKVPEPLKKQLKVGGRLIAPVGSDNYFQELVCILRVSEDEFQVRNMGGVAFVPLIGEHGWPE